MVVNKLLLRNLYIFTVVMMLSSWIYISGLPSHYNAALLIVVSIINLYFVANSKVFTILFLSILYFNYSIAVGEYSIFTGASAPMYEVRSLAIYDLLIYIMVIFNACVIGVGKGSHEDEPLKFEYEPSIVVSCLVGTVVIFLFFFDRNQIYSYEVRISAFYEYSTLLFLLAILFCGRRFFLILLILSSVIIFILNDVAFGGRVTSVQLSLLIILTLFRSSLNTTRLYMLFIVGIILNSFVGVYRSNFILGDLSLESVVVRLIDNAFVFDTVVYGYYSSATHIAALDYFDMMDRIRVFINFLAYVFLDIEGDGSFHLTSFISKNYYRNVGGGLLPSHLYFYLGLTGVIGIGFLLRFLLTKLASSANVFNQCLLIVIIFTVPRWYLYTPLVLFRSILIFSILYFIVISLRKFFKATSKDVRDGACIR